MTSLDFWFWFVLVLWCVAVGGTVGYFIIKLLRLASLRRDNDRRGRAVLYRSALLGRKER